MLDNSIKVVEVKTKKQIHDFINFPLKLYKDNPYFVPPLTIDEKNLFRTNTYSDQCETIYFNAYRDDKIVGRISGILQKASNEKWKQKRVRFTRFDSIDDQEVAKVLFDAVEKWAKSLGMNEVVGPLGFSDLEREGLLIDGFDQLSTFEEQYNYPYYQKLIENLGYQKEVDWTERKIMLPKVIDERIAKISDMMLKKYKLHDGTAKNINEFIKKYGDAFFDIIDKTYVNIYQTVPFTDKMKKSLITSFKLLIDMRFVNVIVDENDRVVCFGICFPSIVEAVQKSHGSITPLMIMRALKAKKHPRIIEFGLVGVLPEYAKSGVSTSMVNKINNLLKTPGIEFAETNLNLEDNYAIQNQWKYFDSVIHKRRRSFIKSI